MKPKITLQLVFLSFALFLFNLEIFSQNCIDLGTGITLSNDEYAFIDFFKNGGRWEPIDNEGHPWYRVYSLDTFKVVNGAYWHWDSDWSGTINNDAWGDNWADCYISYYDMMIDQGKLDTNGFPKQFPFSLYKYRPKSEDPQQLVDPGKPINISHITRRIYFPAELPRSGWVMKWEGTGRLSFQGLENVVADPGTTSTQQGESWRPSGYGFCGYNYNFESTNGGRIVTDLHWMIHGWVLEILESDPADPIRNIVFLYPGLEDEYDAGQVFNPQFIERMQQFSALRFMGYNDANDIECRTIVSSSNPFHDNKMLEWMRWDERTIKSWYRKSNGSGGNYEYIIELANETGVDPWVNIPYCAGEEYTEQLVKLFMSGLDPDLTLYLEVGNEMWNYAPGFSGYRWQAAKRVFEYPGLGDVEGRGAHINKIFKRATEAAGSRNIQRICRVYAGFPRYTDINNRTLNYIEPQYWDAFATTWYFGLTQNNSSDNDCKDPVSGNNWRSVLYNWFLANPGNQAGFNQMYRDCILNEFRCGGGYSNNSDVVLSKYYGKDIICYEGGNHTFYGCENAPTGGNLSGELDFDTPTYPDFITDNDFINAVCKADESEEMAEIYDEIIDSLQSAGVRLANHLSFAGRSSCYGVWSFIQPKDMTQDLSYLLANYPKFRLFSERITTDNCDQQEVVFDTNTVGPGLSILLDGIDDYIEGQNVYIPDESSNYTVEAWFNPLFTDKEQVIVSFSNNGTNNNYNAIKIRTDQKIVWEIGNNTTVQVKLIGPAVKTDHWYHLAVVKNDLRYTLYVNGINVASANYSLSPVTRSNFTIGAIENTDVEAKTFAGEIDEVRLWDTPRSTSEIREYMCKKLVPDIPSYVNLRSYYTFDYPDYVTYKLYDKAANIGNGQLHNITITDRSRYAISGAAIGDFSRYRYQNNWDGVSLSITHPDGDMLAVSNIGFGNPEGIQVYIINGKPHYNNPPEYYDGISDERVLGVFIVNGNDPSYDVTYMYRGNPDEYSGSSEADLRLLHREMYSSEDWLHSGARLNTTANSLTVSCKETSRGEYNLGIRHEESSVRPGSGMAIQNNQAPTEDNYGLLRYLNLDDYTVTFWAKGWGNAFNFTGMLNGGSQRFNIGSSYGQVNCGMRNIGSDWESESIGSFRGYASPDDWVHYAVTRSGTRMTFYANGQIIGQGDFTNQFTIREMRLFHDPSWQVGNYPGGVCNLTMDELSVWNIALDQNTIREWMCKKINEGHPYECKNLILYFNFDQGAGNILEDKRGPSDISLVSVGGGFNYVASGAAIGNESIADYTSPEALVLSHPDGDSLVIERTSGTSTGVHIYRNDFLPPIPSNTDNPSIISMDSTRYWGIFCVKPYGVDVAYSVKDFYERNAQVNLSNESELRLLSRLDNSIAPWSSNISVLPVLADHSLELTGQTRGEYVLGGTGVNTFDDYVAPEAPVFLPVSDSINQDTICGNSTGLAFAVEEVQSVETYIWNIPTGLDGYSTSSSITLNASYSGTTIDTFTISVVAVNAYGQSPAANFDIILLPAPTIADAGPDQVLIPPVLNTTLDGNTPELFEQGTWSVNYGSGILTDVHTPTSAINSLGTGHNTLVWSISNDVCPPTTDSMDILVAPPPIAVTLMNGDSLPYVFCEGDTIKVRAIPYEDVDNNGYQWTMPDGLTLLDNNADSASILVGSGLGGAIQVAALYGTSVSESYLTHRINVNPQPAKPVFVEEPNLFCYKVDETLSIQFNPTIDSVDWILPLGIYPVDFPESTSESITIQALDTVSGYISVKTFNNGCSNSNATDSFAFSVHIAPERPELFLGTDGGTADQFCGGEYALLWVKNTSDSIHYEWTWDVYTNLVEFLDSVNSKALFQMPERNNEIKVRAIQGEGACSTSEWFTYNGWTQDVDPADVNSVTITAPAGQDPMQLQVGQVYTLAVDGTGDYYFWDIPPGFELVDDGDLYDNINQIKVLTEAAGSLDVYTITLRGCSSHSFSLNISTPGAIMPPEYISGTRTICQGSYLNILVSDVGATEYIWTLPNGDIYNTSVPELNQIVSEAMKGNVMVVASNGVYTTPPTAIQIEIQAINLSPLGFIDESGDQITEIAICNGDAGRPIYHKDALASSYIWEIHGSAIQFEPRWEPGHDGESDYELRNRTSPVDTMMPVSWVNWRCQNDGSDNGYIVVTAVNGCGGAHQSDSIYYYWQEPLNVIVPEFTEAPQSLCVGSSVNYEVKEIAGADEYIWSLPNGLMATNIVTTGPSITAQVVNGTGGALTVFARGDVCGGSQTIEQVVEPIKISGEPINFGFIEEPLAACPGDTLTYEVNDIGVPEYNWSVPQGMGSVIVDNSDISDVTVSGSWGQNSRDNMINHEYFIASNNASRSITYVPELAFSGTYKVWISGFVRYDGSLNMPVVVNHQNGTDTRYINTMIDPEDGIWREVGEYEFNAGSSGSVSILTDAASSGVSVADAVKFEIISIQNGTRHEFPVSGSDGGAVCVSVDIPQCESEYTICTSPVTLGGSLTPLVFTMQENSVCEGNDYVFTASDIGATSYSWHLPKGMNIGGATGTVESLGRTVTVSMDTNTTAPVHIGVNGVLMPCNITSDTVYSGPILFDGAGCSACDSFKVTISDLHFIDPASCNGTGTIVIVLSNATDLQVYNVDYNYDLVADATGVVRNDSIVLTGVAQGTAITALVLTEMVNGCQVFSSEVGSIASYAPASIDDVSIVQPSGCNDKGSVQVLLSGVSDGDIFDVDYTGDANFDDTSTVSGSQLIIDSIGIGTEVTQIRIVNQITRCESSVPSGYIIASPSSFTISQVKINNAERCDQGGSVEVNLSGSAELDTFNVLLIGSGLEPVEAVQRDSVLLIEGVAPETAFNQIEVINQNTACSAVFPGDFAIGRPASPEVSLSTIGPLCINMPDEPLPAAIPPGGKYTIYGDSVDSIEPAVLGAGSFVLVYEYVDTNNCSASDSSLIEINPLPIADILGEISPCAGTNEVIYTSDNTSDCRYEWSVYGGTIISGEGSPEISVNWNNADSAAVQLIVTNNITTCIDSGYLSIVFTDTIVPVINGCAEEAEFTAIFDNSWHYTITEDDKQLIPTATDNCTTGNVLGWFAVSGSDTLSTTEFVGFRVEAVEGQSLIWVARDNFGNESTCETSLEFTIEEKPPSAFSPNGDDINDTWQIDFLNTYPECVVKVYNRWGNLVWQSDPGYPVQWDGRKNGKLLPVGTYYYVVQLHDDGSVVKGYVSLIY